MYRKFNKQFDQHHQNLNGNLSRLFLDNLFRPVQVLRRPMEPNKMHLFIGCFHNIFAVFTVLNQYYCKR